MDNPLYPELSNQPIQDNGGSPQGYDGSLWLQPPLSQQLLVEAGGLPTMCQPLQGSQELCQVTDAAVKGAGPLHTAQQGSRDFKGNVFPLANL